MDADTYTTSHGLQSRDAADALERAADILSWNSGCKGDVIMDVGCGPGDNSTRKLVSFFPDAQKVLGVDADPRMVEIAQKQNPHPKVEYVLSGVEDKSLGQRYAEQVDKVFSIHCIHWTEKQKESLQNIHDVLKPGGEAVILVMLKTCARGYMKTLSDHPLWGDLVKASFSKQPLTHYEWHDFSHYQRLLNESGFDVVLCEEEDRTFTFSSFEIFKPFCVAVCPVTSLVPKAQREEFDETLARTWLKCCEVTKEGEPIFKYNTLLMMLRKPNKKH